MSINDLIASKIKKIRLEKNILQKNVAEGLGLSENAYSRIEGGHTQLTINNLFKIAEILGVDIKFFLKSKDDGEDKKQAKTDFSQFTLGTVNINLTFDEFMKVCGAIKVKTEL